MTWTEELDSNLFYAPACREHFLYPDEVQGPGVVYPTLDYKFYKSFILKFVAGDNGEDSCLTALNTIRQNNKDLRAHVGEFRILLNRYIELADTVEQRHPHCRSSRTSSTNPSIEHCSMP
jgi:hypothetical protein